MILRKLKKEYYEDEKPMTEEEKDKLYKRALEAGLIGAGVGTTGIAYGLISDKIKKGAPSMQTGKMDGKKLATGGAILAAPSLALAGYGAYKHYKHKKKEKEEKK